MCSVTLDLISSSIVLKVFVITIISVIFIRNFILPGIRYIEISTLHVLRINPANVIRVMWDGSDALTEPLQSSLGISRLKESYATY